MGILLPIYQIYLCGHSNRHQVMDQKSSFFICPRVSARFLHGFKGCNGYSDLQNTTEGAEIAGQKITMLCTKNDINSKLLKSECSARWALLIRGPGIRVPSSAQNPTRNRKILRGFSIFWGSAHFCTLFAHRRESRVFPCIVCILCIVAELVGAKPLHLAAQDRSVA